jgi:hypothetical protein
VGAQGPQISQAESGIETHMSSGGEHNERNLEQSR